MRKGGIYKIINTVTNKIYIGSAIYLCRRKAQHLSNLRLNKHSNKYLQNSWNKYKEKNFKFEIIEYVPNNTDLITKEQYYIDNLKPAYNLRKLAHSNLGIQHSSETKIKIGTSRLGHKASLSTLEKISMPILQYDLNNNFIKEWSSIREASRQLKLNSGGLSKTCNNKPSRSSCGGFKWKFKIN